MKKITTTLCLIMLLGLSAIAQTQNRVEKKFNVNNDASLKITNSFGDITIDAYDGNVIDVLVVISTESANEKDSKAFMDDIKIQAIQTGNDVDIKTINSHKGIFTSIKNFSIDYTVKIPQQTEVKIDNSFGVVRVNSITGSLILKAEHGDVFIGTASASQNNIEVSFGDVRIEELGTSIIRLQHGDLRAVHLDETNLKMQFGDAKIDRLDGKCQLSIQHGDLEIAQILTTGSSLDLEAQFSDVSIAGMAKGNFDLDLSGSFVDYSWEGSWSSNKLNSGLHESKYRIQTKNQEGITRRVKITANHSNVDLK